MNAGSGIVYKLRIWILKCFKNKLDWLQYIENTNEMGWKWVPRRERHSSTNLFCISRAYSWTRVRLFMANMYTKRLHVLPNLSCDMSRLSDHIFPRNWKTPMFTSLSAEMEIPVTKPIIVVLYISTFTIVTITWKQNLPASFREDRAISITEKVDHYSFLRHICSHFV